MLLVNSLLFLYLCVFSCNYVCAIDSASVTWKQYQVILGNDRLTSQIASPNTLQENVNQYTSSQSLDESGVRIGCSTYANGRHIGKLF